MFLPVTGMHLLEQSLKFSSPEKDIFFRLWQRLKKNRNLNRDSLFFFCMNNVFNEHCFSVKAPLHEQAIILKTVNDASPFATRGSDLCLAGVLLDWSAVGHNIPWHCSEEFLHLEIKLAVYFACCWPTWAIHAFSRFPQQISSQRNVRWYTKIFVHLPI